MRPRTRWKLPRPSGVVPVALVAAVALALAGNAAAATQTRSHTIDFKDTERASVIDTGVQTYHLDAEVLGVGIDAHIGGRIQGGLEVEWVNPVKYDMTWTDSLVRQGETLDMDHVVATQGGRVKVSLFGHVEFGVYDNGVLDTGLPHIDEDATYELGTFDCTIPLPGNSPRPCKLAEKEQTILHLTLFEVLSVDLNVKVEVFLDASGTPIATLRLATTAGDSSGGLQTAIEYAPTSPVTRADHFNVPCTEPAGMDFFYKLTNNEYTAFDTKFSTVVSLWLHFTAAGGVIDLPVKLVNILPPPGSSDERFPLLGIPSLDMTAPNIVENLGPLQPDNRPPVVGVPVAPNGDEGSEIQFHVDATDNCGPPAVRWQFSDGGIAFGTDPKHTFADNGRYTGLVTATDDTGNSTTKTFALDIANVRPSVNAGPDTTADWGRRVDFNGQATDPGAADQSTLQYTWRFGDGTPSATGGPSVVHAYAQPGDYVATLEVCDKNGACASSTRTVHVTKRDTSIGYLGDTTGTYDTAATLAASLVDEYGQTVNGRSIAFSVGSDGPLNALTNSSGIATKSYTPTLGAGSYTGNSQFAGDSLYNSSSSSNAFAMATKATTTAYTGATTSGPNKVVVLSTVLRDASGKPLAGRTIQFRLGSQSATAVTDANGIATTNLKLNQKNGTYTVSATYAPSGVDAPRYLGSSHSAIFKLQAK